MKKTVSSKQIGEDGLQRKGIRGVEQTNNGTNEVRSQKFI
jgi:hypothetical protein